MIALESRLVELKFLLIQDGSALAHTSISFVEVSFERAG